MHNAEFAEIFAACLKRHYGGKIPSFATIARDFAFHSPAGLAPISAETPRKWVRGQSLPSLERLQTLAHWLGPEILDPLNGNFLKKADKSHSEKSSDTADEVAEVGELLEQLSHEEIESVKGLLHHLVNAHTKPRGNGKV